MVNPFTFNNMKYNSSTKIGLHDGIYTLIGATEKYPIGFVTNNKNFNVIDGNKTSYTKVIENVLVEYYTGLIAIQVLGDFGRISYHSYNEGYMGGFKKLMYTNKCFM